MAAIGAATMAGLGTIAADIAASAGMYAGYAAGAGQMLGGGALMGAAGAGGLLMSMGGTTIGKGALAGAGGAAGRGFYNWLTGKPKSGQPGKPNGGCSCTSGKQQMPKLSCEQKCQYGRIMAQKCQGCKGYSPSKKCGTTSKRKGYTRSRTYGGPVYTPYKPRPYSYKTGYTGRPKGRQGRIAWRDFKKTQKHPKRSARKDRGGPKWGKRR